jgi:hypothetical protein
LVLIFVLIGFLILKTKKQEATLEQNIIGTYIYPISSFGNLNSHYQGVSGLFCPIIFLEDRRMYHCDLGWNKYEIDEDVIKVSFNSDEYIYIVKEIDDKKVVLFSQEEIIARRIDELFLANVVLKNKWCSVYSIDDQVIYEAIEIDEQKVIFYSSSFLDVKTLVNCEILNRNTISCQDTDDIFVFSYTPEYIHIFKWDLLRFVVFGRRTPDRIFLPCNNIEDLEDWTNHSR